MRRGSTPLFALACLLVAAGACAQAGERGPATPSRGGASASGSEAPRDPRMRAILDAHNRHRAQHCAPPLAWSDELARTAQAWADQLARRGCGFEHSRTRYGENLAAGTAGRFSPESLVDLWYRERADYDYRSGRFSMRTGHFTQLVWRDTRLVGCGTVTCEGRDVWVCNYDPPGNVEGAFRENVQSERCGR